MYAFHAEDLLVDVLMEERETQFDIWRGKKVVSDSLILVDDAFPLNNKIKSTYQNIQFIKKINIQLKDLRIKSYELYIGRTET